jgi:hypothetical protein
MPRFLWLWPALLVTACRHARPVEELLPPTVGAVWHRAVLKHPPISDAPDPVPRSAVDEFQSATYEGPGKLEARVYVLNSPATALELAQRWRPSADTVVLNPGRYFVVVQWQNADRQALQAFAAELQMRLGKPKQGA